MKKSKARFPKNLWDVFIVNEKSIKGTHESLQLMGYPVSEEALQEKLKEVAALRNTKPIAGGTLTHPDERIKKLSGKTYILTSAQNNTYVNKDFFLALVKYAEVEDAELLVAPFTYNKSGFQNLTKDADGIWYDPLIVPYLIREPVQLGNELVFCAELDILPTAVDPLSGLENYCRDKSGVIPHTKVALRSLPGMPDDGARFLYTTGAVTQRNYIQRKAGQKAEFHHVFGAVVVEVTEDGGFFARQITADKTGAFYDLNTQYSKHGVKTGQFVEAINWGDIHIEKSDWQIEDGAFHAKTSMLNTLKPKYQFIHDLTDFTTRNHHNIRNPHFLARQVQTGRTVENELTLAGEFLKSIERKGTTTVVVESNHHEAYERWLREADIRYDPINARFFHESNMMVYKAIEDGNPFSPYEWAVKKNVSLSAVFLDANTSFKICPNNGGIECGLHGHNGPNGARGNPRNLRNIGSKANTGHTHSASIYDGVYTAGVTANLDMDYNKGPSSWSHSHIITYKNGKRAIITQKKDGTWKR